MKNVLVLLCVFTLGMTMAQVGINTILIAPGVLLQVEDPQGQSGVLFPKVEIPNLGDESPLPSTILEGTMVYNTLNATGKCYYFWDDVNDRWATKDQFIGKKARFSNASKFNNTSNANVARQNAIELEIFDATTFNEAIQLYESVGRSRVRIKSQGRYKIIVNIDLEGQSGYNVIETRLKISNSTGDTFVGGYYESNELEDTGTNQDDDGSIHFTDVIEIDQNDEISIVAYGIDPDADIVYLGERNECSFTIIKIN